MNFLSRVFFLLIIITISCTDKKNKIEQSTPNETENPISIQEARFALMDAKLDKAIDLLGQPDYQNNNPLGSLGHLIYYNKVEENGHKKNLLIFWHYNHYRDLYQTIKLVKAVNNGEKINLGFYGTITINAPMFNKPLKLYHSGNIDSETGIIKNISQRSSSMAGDNFKMSNASWIESKPDANEEIQYIKRLYNSLDTAKVSLRIYQSPKDMYRFKTYKMGNAILLKSIKLQGDGEVYEYFFYKNKIRYVNSYDFQNMLYNDKSYVDENGNVIRFYRNNVISSCEKWADCKYDLDSMPYYLLKLHPAN